jgi:hypothetical protein
MSPNWFLGNWTLVWSGPKGVLLQDPFDSLCGEPQSAWLTSGAKGTHIGSEIWGISLVKASNFLLIFGFLTWFVLRCPQPSLLFVKELGKPVINGEAEPAPTLIHSPSWMSPCPRNNPKTHQRNVKIELRDPHLVEGPLYTGLKKLGAKFEHFWLFCLTPTYL